MNENDAQSPTEMLQAALSHLKLALELLDRSDAPGQIGANIDLACHQLEGALQPAGTNGTLDWWLNVADLGAVSTS
jgi:hypothetical protein